MSVVSLMSLEKTIFFSDFFCDYSSGNGLNYRLVSGTIKAPKRP